MNIVVYLGANMGKEGWLSEEVQKLGQWIGSSRHTLIYGGSKTGLMGKIADSVLTSHGKVIGVEPKMFIESEFQHEGITELIITEDMPERKAKMIELGDAFIAFPGGTGTLEEISEVASLSALELSDAPCIFYNLRGYYDEIKAFFQKMVDMGLSNCQRQRNIFFAESIEEIDKILNRSVNND